MIYFKFVDNGMKEPEEDVYLAMVERMVRFGFNTWIFDIFGIW